MNRNAFKPDPVGKHLEQLVGWTVESVIRVWDDPADGPSYGLVLTKGSGKLVQLFAHIQADPEGNPGGWIDIKEERYGT